MALFNNRKTGKIENLSADFGAYKGADANPGHRLNPHLTPAEQMNNTPRIPGAGPIPGSSQDYRNKQDLLARVNNSNVPGAAKPRA